jgi:hypothetical protein
MFSASVSDVCCKCFRHMLQVFSCFRHILQVFHLGVAKVDPMLHMLQWDQHGATYCSCWVTFKRRRSATWACEKSCADIRAHVVGCAKNRRCRFHFSCAHLNTSSNTPSNPESLRAPSTIIDNLLSLVQTCPCHLDTSSNTPNNPSSTNYSKNCMSQM